MPADRSVRVVIVGAGIGGIAAAIELRRHGFDDATVLERGSRLGGTWHYNDYPGCACDVPSHLYSFSFAQRRDWSRLCSPQVEILEYLTAVARDQGVDSLVEYGADVSSCEWDGSWTVSCSDGRVWKADALLIATGQLHQPAIPAIPGRFDGRSFHSSRWDHSLDLRGKRVAVIGTGASAVQFVPRVAGQVERLYVFQRTGNWFWPRAIGRTRHGCGRSCGVYRRCRRGFCLARTTCLPFSGRMSNWCPSRSHGSSRRAWSPRMAFCAMSIA